MDSHPAYGLGDPFVSRFDMSDFMPSEEKCFRFSGSCGGEKGPNALTVGFRMW